MGGRFAVARRSRADTSSKQRAPAGNTASVAPPRPGPDHRPAIRRSLRWSRPTVLRFRAGVA